MVLLVNKFLRCNFFRDVYFKLIFVPIMFPETYGRDYFHLDGAVNTDTVFGQQKLRMNFCIFHYTLCKYRYGAKFRVTFISEPYFFQERIAVGPVTKNVISQQYIVTVVIHDSDCNTVYTR
ncbi:hypothetical protein NPIL_684631 [Nephila pilipes]|uniref:Uncharacterized protein n=1 Tax=Nephila pilipes TaxID=299642 RepID=A0A8X6MSJ7_NEPPI|nr:hypothetical protein NPIL_684631 [Nephila pilipes]